MIGDVGEGVGKEPNVCTDVDGNPAARYQLGKDREFRLARACLLRDALPVEDRWWHQHREPIAQGQRHQQCRVGRQLAQDASSAAKPTTMSILLTNCLSSRSEPPRSLRYRRQGDLVKRLAKLGFSVQLNDRLMSNQFLYRRRRPSCWFEIYPSDPPRRAEGDRVHDPHMTNNLNGLHLQVSQRSDTSPLKASR